MVFENSKNQKLNKFIIKGEYGDEHAWYIVLYMNKKNLYLNELVLLLSTA